MDQLQLAATKRDVLGKGVNLLRRQGITPVHVYGKGLDSEALQCDNRELLRVLVVAQRTGLISLTIKGERKPRAVVVREVQRNVIGGGLLHVDFYQVRMEEEMRVDVPVVLIGEAPVLSSREYTLYQELDTITVQCLPASIPTSIEVDTAVLTEPDQVLRVKDIVVDEDITVVNDPEVVLARIATAVAAGADEEAVAGEAPAEEAAGAAPSEE